MVNAPSYEESPLLDGERHRNTTTGHDATDGDTARMDTRLSFKITAAMLSFSTLGLFNSSIGAVLPLLSRHYELTDVHVSSIFLAGPIGYILAAQCSDSIHSRYGQRGIAIIGPILQIMATALAASHTNFSVVLVAFAMQGLGTGLLDGSWCAWAGSMVKANTISGLLHGSYSAGGAAGPFFVTLLTARHQPWWTWYYILSGISLLSFIALATAFRHETAAVYKQSKLSNVTNANTDIKLIFKHPATWLCAGFFLTYVGTETAISGWIVSFMLRKRRSTVYEAGLSSSGYWVGMAIGRFLLGFVTDRLGVRRATVFYFLAALVLEITFAIFASPVASVVAMTALGFVMGPLFPSGVVVLTRLLPSELHIAAVSFVSSLGQVGGAFLPFAIGAVVQGLGIGVFSYAILIQTALSLLVWVAYARLRPHSVQVARSDIDD